ncbi:MAG: hypothetical protein ACC652_10365, partial [Acidimicrobiales bacterium]
NRIFYFGGKLLNISATAWVRKVVPFGEIKTSQALGQVCLTHGHAHFGEICSMRVLQGLSSSVI